MQNCQIYPRNRRARRLFGLLVFNYTQGVSLPGRCVDLRNEMKGKTRRMALRRSVPSSLSLCHRRADHVLFQAKESRSGADAVVEAGADIQAADSARFHYAG